MEWDVASHLDMSFSKAKSQALPRSIVMATQTTPPQLPSCRVGSTHNDSDGRPLYEDKIGENGPLTPVSDISVPASSRSVEDVDNASRPPAQGLRHAAKRQLDRLTSTFSRKDGNITNASATKDLETDLSDYEKATPPTDQKQQDAHSEPAYHVFTTRKKWELVYIVSLAGLFSPLSSNIYFPALGDIAEVGLRSDSWSELLV